MTEYGGSAPVGATGKAFIAVSFEKTAVDKADMTPRAAWAFCGAVVHQ